MIVGASMFAYSQGTVNFSTFPISQTVVADVNGHLSSASGSYVYSTNFTVSLYSLSGNTASNYNTTALGADAYGYLTTTAFLADGFVAVSTAQLIAGGHGTLGPGGFSDPATATLTGSSGGYSGGVYTAFDVLAIVAWTGSWTSLSQAIANGAYVGIITFVNPLGPGNTDPNVPNLTGWAGLTASPAALANDPGYGADLIMAPVLVPEPATCALMGLGGLSLLLFRRRK